MEWKSNNLENLLDAIIDYRGKTPTKTSVGIPLVTAKIIKNGVINEFNEFIAEEDYDRWMVRGLPKPGDVVLTTEAPLGEVAQLDERKIALAQRVVCLRGKSNILDNTYLKYYFLSNYGKKKLKSRESGTTVTGIKQSELRQVEVRYPSFGNQKRIASILSSLDDKIAVNKKICENLEAQAQALFKHWFVDFAPFKDGKFVESELGLIPEGWRVGTLSEVADLVKTSIKPQGNTLYSHYSIPAFDNNQTPSCDSGESIKSSKFAIQDSVIMLSKLNPEHKRIWFIQNVGSNAVCSTEFLPFYAKDRGQSVFVYCYLNCPQNYREIANGAKGTTNSHQRLDANAVLTRKLAYKNDVVTRFSKLVGDFMKQKDIALQENLRLATLRDTLLPKLMSGEIKI